MADNRKPPVIPPELVGKAILDPKFRAALLRDPKGTLGSSGFPELAKNPDFVKALQAADPVMVELLLKALDKHTKVPQPYWI